MITLSRVERYEDLNADSKDEGHEKFLAKTRVLWKELAVHGQVKNGELKSHSDLDGKTALFMFERAGIKADPKPKYVPQGGFEPGHINIDTGNKDGVVIEDEGKTAYFDHHSPEGGRNSSATKLVYETMIQLGLIDKDPTLDKMVEFVTQMDNKSFPNESDYYKDCYRTVLGLWKFIQPNHLYNYLKSGRIVTDKLSDKDLKYYGLIYTQSDGTIKNRSQEKFAKYEQSETAYAEAERGKMIKDTKYGKVLIDVGNKIPLGFDTALAHGCQGYVIWDKPKNFFFVTVADRDLPNDFLPKGEGIKIRGRMWIKENSDKKPVSIALIDIINALNK